MTTTTESVPAAPPPASASIPGAAAPRPSGTMPGRLLKAELLKIRTTNTWWIFGLAALAYTSLALLLNIVAASFELDQANNPPDFSGGVPPGEGGVIGPELGQPSPAEIEQARQDWERQFGLTAVLLRSAANVYTSGQLFGLLFVMLLGVIIVTNEFYHQTATATFLTTPRRTSVILSKLAAAVGIGVIFWAVSTAISVGIGSAYFSANGYQTVLGEWPVQRSILLNLVAYGLWAVFGVGLGVLIRSQIGATVTGMLLYLLSFPLAFTFFNLVHTYLIKEDWVMTAMVSVPFMATMVMVTPDPTNLWEQAPDSWVGAVVLIGYGVVAGLIGTLITRKRDIS